MQFKPYAKHSEKNTPTSVTFVNKIVFIHQNERRYLTSGQNSFVMNKGKLFQQTIWLKKEIDKRNYVKNNYIFEVYKIEAI